MVEGNIPLFAGRKDNYSTMLRRLLFELAALHRADLVTVDGFELYCTERLVFDFNLFQEVMG